MNCRMIVLGLVAYSCFSSLWGQESEDFKAEESPVFSKRTVDYSEIRKLGTLRVALPYSRTNFFLDKDQFRGFEFELFRELEKFLNTSRRRGEPVLTVVLQLVPVANLINELTEGRVDIAAGIVMTEERQRLVSFTQPYLKGINTVVVSNASVPPISSVQELSGQKVLVNRGSSYPGLLKRLEEELKKQGRKPPRVELAETLETEHIFELVNVGAASWTIAHQHHADLWKQVLTNLRVYSDLTLGEPAQFAWAVRKDNPELLGLLNDFVAKNRQGTLIGNLLLKRYYKSTQWISKDLALMNRDRVLPFIDLFKKYGESHTISWIGLAAVAFQESGWDPTLRSRAGAVGLMQIKPETAADVGVVGIENPEKNVQAAARYFDLLAEKYFNEPEIDRHERAAFVLAAYNAGPARIKRLRNEASEQNIDPDRWFGEVETLALKRVGREPVRYVANVGMYYFWLRHMLLTEQERSTESLDLQ